MLSSSTLTVKRKKILCQRGKGEIQGAKVRPRLVVHLGGSDRKEDAHTRWAHAHGLRWGAFAYVAPLFEGGGRRSPSLVCTLYQKRCQLRRLSDTFRWCLQLTRGAWGQGVDRHEIQSMARPTPGRVGRNGSRILDDGRPGSRTWHCAGTLCHPGSEGHARDGGLLGGPGVHPSQNRPGRGRAACPPAFPVASPVAFRSHAAVHVRWGQARVVLLVVRRLEVMGVA